MKQKMALYLMMVLILLGVVACGGTTSAPGGTTSVPVESTMPETAVASDVPAPVSGDARAEILAAYQKSTSQPYRTDSEIRSSNGDMTLMGEMVPPDSIHTLMTSANFSMEMIIIGTQGWQAIDGDWQPLPAETVQMVAATAFPAAILAQLQATLTNPKALGRQELNGRSVNVYQFESVTEGVTSSTTVYVDAETGLPVQQEISGEAGGVTSTTTQKITYEPITISPPAP